MAASALKMAAICGAVLVILLSTAGKPATAHIAPGLSSIPNLHQDSFVLKYIDLKCVYNQEPCKSSCQSLCTQFFKTVMCTKVICEPTCNCPGKIYGGCDAFCTNLCSRPGPAR